MKSAKQPIQLSILTMRSVGLRFAEGVLASNERLAGQISLDRIVSCRNWSGGKPSDSVDVEEWSNRFRISYVGLADTNDANLNLQSGNHAVIAGWPHRLPLDDVAVPSNHILGIHPRRLPEGRGRSPIPWSIENSEKANVLSIFQLTSKMDGGPVIAEVPWDLNKRDDATSAYLKVSQAYFVAGQLVSDILVRREIRSRLQNQSIARIWPHRSGDSIHLAEDMTCEEIRVRVRAQSPPFPSSTVLWNGRLLWVDSHKSQLIWHGVFGDSIGVINFLCSDGLVPLVVTEVG